VAYYAATVSGEDIMLSGGPSGRPAVVCPFTIISRGAISL